MQITEEKDGVVFLGRQGENLARQVRFSVAGWRALYGDGTFQLLVQRPGDAAPYPAEVTADADAETVSWDVKAYDTAAAGEGKCELRCCVGSLIAKSRIWITRVAAALGEDGGGEPAAVQPSWVDGVLQAGAAAEAAANRAEAAAVHSPEIRDGRWWVWDPETGEYTDTGVPAAGDGALPGGGTAGQYLTVGTAGAAVWADLPAYDGAYEVTPQAGAAVTLSTRQTCLDRDVVVREIPIYETSNQSGGYTANIGG